MDVIKRRRGTCSFLLCGIAGRVLVTCFSTARPLIALPEWDPHSEPKGQFSLNITAEVLGRLLLLRQSATASGAEADN